MADIEEQLRKQAAKHGLPSFDPSQSTMETLKEHTYVEQRNDHLNDVELQNGGFAGFRTASAQPEGADAKMSLDEYSSSEELEKVGLDELKEQLKLRGMKCGGTLEERARRLFECKEATLALLKAQKPQLFVKPAAKKELALPTLDDRNYRKRQQGPLLPGQKRAKNQKSLPKSWVYDPDSP
eukprot:TRINITY_DN19805_c0_g1_i3.p1 TRINITY_DN19805_c0_g1~~TRINITY_DN19805_c0_g1_i3.p1  ORF type:complete len:182 (-),score=54.85 TRINITY_DN19805_c0_g1_i3:59-604(-)